MKYKTVNKLIMVGNGFDLAHGLKSGFNHFSLNYIQSVLQEFALRRQYTDSQIEINLGSDNLDLMPIHVNDDNSFAIFRNMKSKRIKSQLFEKIIIEIGDKNWVDIEVSFYDLLNFFVEKKYVSDIKKRNSELEYIRHLLIEYLKKEEARITITPHPELLKQFHEPILQREALLNTIDEDKKVNSYYLLNFNYTSILKKYADQMPPSRTTLNHIHGALNTEDSMGQEPIFGFGDELDKNYSAFEDLRDDSAFEHIKSFKYLEAENYRNLMEFIEAEPFQVCIFGHSCGVSDRTMLNKIFEHENCISIKIYYYQNGDKNDYTTKNYSIARCFRDKSSFRNKVVNLERCSPMVQPSQ